jgi:hypothetical protein
MLQIQFHLWKQSSQNLETPNHSQSFNLSFLNLKNPNSLYASKGEKNPSSSSSTPNSFTSMFPFTFFRPLSNFVPFDHKYVMPPYAHQAFLSSKSYDEFFFLLTKKLKPKDVHGKIIQLHTRESFGKRLAQHCPWGHLTKWYDLEKLTPNIHELRVCVALSKIRQSMC